MKQRVITAIVIIAVVFFPLYFGGFQLKLLTLLIVGTGAFEWCHIQHGYDKWPILIVPMLGLMTYITGFFEPSYLYIHFALCICIIWTLPIFIKDISVENSFSMIAFFSIFSLVLWSMKLLYLEHRYLWTIVFATYGSDTGALFVGMKFGRHKLCPEISPKKTWEGFVGGFIVGFILSFLMSRFWKYGLNSTLNLILCILCPIFAELGDLCFSSIKRYVKIKDFSNLLPGHGGVLDRVDSLLMNIILFGFLYTLII